MRARVLDEEDYAGIALRLRCSESVVRQRVSRGLATLPQAPRRRRRGHARRAPRTPDRERTAEPGDALEQAFAVFRRPQRDTEPLPSSRMAPGSVDGERTRLLGDAGSTRVYAVPTMIRGAASLCLVAVPADGSARSCSPVARAVAEASPPILSSGDVNAVLVRDDTSDVRHFTATTQGYGELQNNALLWRRTYGDPGISWTGASGTRYVHRPPSVTAAAPPRSCPETLQSLPADPLEPARRAALIAVDRVFPRAVRATVVRAAVPADGPCSAELAPWTVEVELRLVSATGRSSTGRVLTGVQEDQMRVVYFMR